MADVKDTKTATQRGNEGALELSAGILEGAMYAPSAIVNTIWDHFLPFRGGRPVAVEAGEIAAAAPAKPTRDQIVTTIEQSHYLRINAASKTGGRIIFVVVDDESKYAGHVPDLKKLLATVQLDKGIKAGKVDEIIFIAGEALMEKKALVEVVMGANVPGVKPTYALRPYHLFYTNIMAHKGMPRAARILAAADRDAFLARERLKLSDNASAPASDPMCVWMGAVAGDCIELELDSENAGLKSQIVHVL